MECSAEFSSTTAADWSYCKLYTFLHFTLSYWKSQIAYLFHSTNVQYLQSVHLKIIYNYRNVHTRLLPHNTDRILEYLIWLGQLLILVKSEKQALEFPAPATPSITIRTNEFLFILQHCKHCRRIETPWHWGKKFNGNSDWEIWPNDSRLKRPVGNLANDCLQKNIFLVYWSVSIVKSELYIPLYLKHT